MNRIVIPVIKRVDLLDPYEKGRLFEEYVYRLFNETHFKLIEWRKAQRFKDRSLPNAYSNPDLELIFAGVKNYKFAVECKWRKEFFEGKINWARRYQISTYIDFERKFGIPVFIAIGVGGEPSKPEKLFVTPLCNISRYPEVYESELIPYKRKATRKFFYDTIQLKLF
jgi:hypothetical protein